MVGCCLYHNGEVGRIINEKRDLKMNTTKCRKYKVAKEGTYVFPRYGLKISLSLNDEYAIVGYTRHKNETCCILQKADNPKSVKFPLRKCELEKHFTEC